MFSSVGRVCLPSFHKGRTGCKLKMPILACIFGVFAVGAGRTGRPEDLVREHLRSCHLGSTSSGVRAPCESLLSLAPNLKVPPSQLQRQADECETRLWPLFFVSLALSFPTSDSSKGYASSSAAETPHAGMRLWHRDAECRNTTMA
ncbi:hypothetical protein L7F22_032508 [Adiantum nelumboides]|nr:hypothetical protein [Adiantum nelumboides]